MGGRGFLKKAGLELPKVIAKRGNELGKLFSTLAISLYLLVGFAAFSPELLTRQPTQPQLSAVAYVQPGIQNSHYYLEDATAEPAIVIDMARVLSDEQRSIIVKESRSLRQQTGADIAVFTEMEIAKDTNTPQQQAEAVFNDWRLGDPRKGNGVLIQLIKSKQSFKVLLGQGLDESYGQFRGWFSVVQQNKIAQLMRDGQEGEALVTTVRDYAQMVRNVDKLGDYVVSAPSGISISKRIGVVTLISASGGAIMYSRSKQCDDELRSRLTEKLGPDAVGSARLLRYANISELTDPRDQMEARLESVAHGVFQAEDGRKVVVGWPRAFCTYDRCSDCGAWAFQSDIQLETERGRNFSHALGQCWNCIFKAGMHHGLKTGPLRLVPRKKARASANDANGLPIVT